MSQSERVQPKVLIVGAGPAGLALAIELGHRQIPCLVVERNDRVGYAPRAKTTHVRIREHMRRWGIANQLAEASPMGVDYPSDIVFVTRLGGYPLAKISNAFNCAPVKNALYAEHAQWIPQYTLEEVMRRHAQSLPGVEIRFNCRHLSCEQQGDQVVSRLSENGSDSDYVVTSDFLVGADGSRSRIRDAIGAVMHGQQKISRHYNVIFRAPGLAAAHKQGRGVLYWQVNEDMPSVIGPMDQGDIWCFMPAKLAADETMTEQEAINAIRKATGIDLPYEILSSDEWVASSLIADCYRDRRIFLTGDACHLHPPFGGFGMFLGVLDSIDLGWKMAAVLKGQGGQALLDSYEIERKGVHEFVVAEAVKNHLTLTDKFVMPGIEQAGAAGDQVRAAVGAKIKELKQAEFSTLGVVLGYRYEQSPIIVSDGSKAPPQTVTEYIPSATPGCRAPHAWLADGSALFDHFGQDFTLLVTGDIDAGFDRLLQQQAKQAGVPVTLLSVADAEVADLYQARYTLIRPDQHVAWRGDSWPADAVDILARVAGFSTVKTAAAC